MFCSWYDGIIQCQGMWPKWNQAFTERSGEKILHCRWNDSVGLWTWWDRSVHRAAFKCYRQVSVWFIPERYFKVKAEILGVLYHSKHLLNVVWGNSAGGSQTVKCNSNMGWNLMTRREEMEQKFGGKLKYMQNLLSCQTIISFTLNNVKTSLITEYIKIVLFGIFTELKSINIFC